MSTVDDGNDDYDDAGDVYYNDDELFTNPGFDK